MAPALKPQLLLVDDEESVRRLVGKFLTEWHYDVTRAENGERGLALLQERAFHLAVVDVVLPDTDGLDLMMEMKAVLPGLPVVLLTGVGFDEILMQEAREKGADGFASKTLPLPHLLAVIRRVLKQYKRETKLPELSPQSPSLEQ